MSNGVLFPLVFGMCESYVYITSAVSRVPSHSIVRGTSLLIQVILYTFNSDVLIVVQHGCLNKPLFHMQISIYRQGFWIKKTFQGLFIVFKFFSREFHRNQPNLHCQLPLPLFNYKPQLPHISRERCVFTSKVSHCFPHFLRMYSSCFQIVSQSVVAYFA